MIFGTTSATAFGIFIGALVSIFLFSLLFRYALLGRSETAAERFIVVALTAVVAIGVSGFGSGSEGFWNRMTHPPHLISIVSYSVAALIVGFVAWPRATVSAADGPGSMRPTVSPWRYVALLVVIPMMFLGLGNVAGSTYSVAVHGFPDPVLGVTRTQMRTIMINGDLGTFWTMMDEKAPEDFDRIIDRIFENRERYRDAEDGRRHLDEEIVRYQTALAVHGPAMTDQQRKTILQSNLTFVKEFEDRPTECADVAATGGRSLDPELLLPAKDAFNNTLIATVENLLEASQSASDPATGTLPVTEEHYAALGDELANRNLSDAQMKALIDEDPTNPAFCSASISFLEVLIDLDGRAGEALRFAAIQELLSASP